MTVPSFPVHAPSNLGSLAENGKNNQCVKRRENGHKQLKTKTDTDKQKCKKEMANGVETWSTKTNVEMIIINNNKNLTERGGGGK